MDQPRAIGIIPARLASTRLPEKPLKEIHGKSLLQRVYERAAGCRTLSSVVVATDSEQIRDEALRFGAPVVMTSPDIRSGSERVGVASRLVEGGPWDLVVNIQGDMPFIKPALVDQCVSFLVDAGTRFDMATLAAPIEEEEHFRSPHVVKVVVTPSGEALYFSRAPIPHSRDGRLMRYRTHSGRDFSVFGLKHFGLYVYRPHVLPEFETGEAQLEEVERLEQLRLLERGYRIGVTLVEPELVRDAVEVDTPEDLARAIEQARSG